MQKACWAFNTPTKISKQRFVVAGYGYCAEPPIDLGSGDLRIWTCHNTTGGGGFIWYIALYWRNCLPQILTLCVGCIR